MNLMNKIIIVFLCFFIYACTATKHGKSQISEDEIWFKIAQEKNTTEAYKIYLPRIKTDSIRMDVRRKIEENRWGLAKTINNVDSYKFFIEEYPNSKYSQLAKDLIAEMPNKSIVPYQKEMWPFKIKDWKYISELIEYIKTNPTERFVDDAFEVILKLLRKSYPSGIYNMGGQDFEKLDTYPQRFKEFFGEALKYNCPYVIVYAERFQKVSYLDQPMSSTGRMSIIVQEIGGKELNIYDAYIYLNDAHCSYNYYNHEKLSPIKLKPYENLVISLSYHAQCDQIGSIKMGLLGTAEGSNCGIRGGSVNITPIK